jgi:hypothetical protein
MQYAASDLHSIWTTSLGSVRLANTCIPSVQLHRVNMLFLAVEICTHSRVLTLCQTVAYCIVSLESTPILNFRLIILIVYFSLHSMTCSLYMVSINLSSAKQCFSPSNPLHLHILIKTSTPFNFIPSFNC